MAGGVAARTPPLARRSCIAATATWPPRPEEDASMPTCDQCGNDYDKAFQVTMAGRTMTFDSFECAIQAMAPTCAHCGVRIVGHGVEEGGNIFCCAHCAKQQGGTTVRDRA
jgi:hypothetical protein